MNVLVRFLDEYATAILYAGITAFAGAAGVVLKRIGSRYFSNRTKRRVVRNCIRAVERVYGDLPEEEQYREKVKAVAETLEVKGIRIAEIETMLRIDEEEEASARGVVPEQKKAHRSVGIRHCDTREPCRSSHRILRPGIFKGISRCSGRSARRGIKN